MHSEHALLAAGSNKWAYALNSGVFPVRTRARRTASARFEVAMQSAIPNLYNMALWGLVDMGSVRVCRMRVLAVANDRVHDGVSAAVVVVVETWHLGPLENCFPSKC